MKHGEAVHPGLAAPTPRVSAAPRPTSRPASRSRVGRPIKTALTYLALSVAAFCSVFPVAWIAMMSIKQPIDAISLPPVLVFTPTLDNYRAILVQGAVASSVNIRGYLINSLVIGIGSTAVTIGVSLLAAYGLTRFKFWGRGMLGFAILATRMLPPIATIVPMLLLMNALGLYDTHVGLGLAYLAVNVPFAVWMLRGFLEDVPIEVEEAAAMDGANRFQILTRVVLPLVTPGLMASSVYAFLLAWNDFTLALVLTARESKTLPLMVMSFFTAEGVAWGPMSAAVTIALTPPVLFVLLLQRYLARGLTMGAVKG